MITDLAGSHAQYPSDAQRKSSADQGSQSLTFGVTTKPELIHGGSWA
jgi:hypothetical protein